MSKEMFVQVSDCKLYAKLLSETTGKPTIIMDAGYGDFSKAWDSVIGDISKLSSVLIYDRAGLGKSERSLNPRTSRDMVKELKQLLVKAKIEPPYILVGHSFGGVNNMRIFATEYQNDVCGLVLIDSTPEDYRKRFLPMMSKEFQRAYNKQFIYEGNYDEFMESLEHLKDTKIKLNVPVIVLSAGKKDHYSNESQELWNEMQREILEISADGELVIAKNSTHYIQNVEPEEVVSAIKKLIDKMS
ncbi:MULTISPECIES: alpha/beta fold hydrolase [Bacillaceae]|uniref:alpha/beta fold hydrolase n=1 Tax=Bacillaceae TaxID=186817 RepID=UPI000BFCC140|nr:MULTISPECIES: alpha/beta hydrolase [Bacillaceae]PGT80944.1 alpha/beta hydrolase [Bacillus sp. AFS040349]UGB28814.1 alpha/beta hydrolase [Metabacillus sp. B2-18]